MLVLRISRSIKTIFWPWWIIWSLEPAQEGRGCGVKGRWAMKLVMSFRGKKFGQRVKRVNIGCRVFFLISRGCVAFGRPLAGSDVWACAENSFRTTSQSDLPDLTLSMRKVMRSPWIADFRFWTVLGVAIFGADQKERFLRGREWRFSGQHANVFIHQGISKYRT